MTGITGAGRVAVAVAVVLAVVGGTVLFFAPSADPGAGQAEKVPGAQLAGVVSAQTVEFDGELDRRTLDARVKAADGNASRAAVVATAAEEVSSRLESVAVELETARDGYENGTLSESAYRNRVTGLVAQTELLEARANYLATVAVGLPDTVQMEYGIEPMRLRGLADSADSLATAEQRLLARTLAGEDIGGRLADDDVDDDRDDDTDDRDDDRDDDTDDRDDDRDDEDGGTDAPDGEDSDGGGDAGDTDDTEDDDGDNRDD